MTAERDSMTLNEVSVPALGVEERSDEAPRAGRARPTPDPEVVAKPERRQFTAVSARVLEEADRCTQPGEVGRLLRREGLYSSHLTLAQGAAQGLAAGVGREEARRATGRTQPAGCEGARARGASPGARVAHPHTILDVQGKVAGLLGLNLEPNALLIAALAAQVGAPACQASRASFYRRQRCSPVQRPPGRCVKPSASRSSMCSPARASSTVRRRRSWRRCSTKAITCAGAAMYRILAADQPVRERRNQREHPQYTKPELVATAPNQTWSWDITKLLGPTKWTYFYLRRARHLQPLRGRLDGRRPGELGAGRSSHRRDLPQTGRPAPGAHPALRPRRADDEQVHRTTARRPRRDPFTEPPSGVRRQPLLRGAVQDPEVPPRLPWPLPRHHRREPSAELPWYNTEHRHGGIACSPRTTSITIEPRACWSSAGGPFKPPGPVMNASFEGSHNRIPFPKPSGSTYL